MSFNPPLRLAPFTIIPPQLYVRRAADRQIRSVIEQMGRPGYVLVARQMGKTNLLLNARREMQDQFTLFVYFDLSQKFENERQCFRAIIDSAMNAHIARFRPLRAQMEVERSRGLSAQQEHESELRQLLSVVPLRLIIILDEIDSLTSSSFSDIIFAQIRSVYFAGRTNNPDFNKLTYLLSGVVEPSDIIKDPRISPFNIGEKIYLDDFSQTEVLAFLENANLSLDVSTVQRLWFWTGGHPRILWDVCAQLEMDIAKGIFISPDHVDEVVNFLYLEDFGRPPVDHIRQMVEQDDTLREALTLIREGKAAHLDEVSKTRLYLTGIISSRLRTSHAQIKNQIISGALSAAWLQEVAVRKKGLLLLATEQYTKSNFKDALRLYFEYIRHDNGTSELNAGVYNNIGWCYRSTGQSQKALDLIVERPVSRMDDPYEYFEQKLLQAYCYVDTNRPDAAIPLFQEILAGNRNDAAYLTSKINLGSLQQNSHDDGASESSEQLFLDVIEIITSGRAKAQAKEKKALLSIARLNYASMLIKKNEIARAQEELKRSLEDSAVQDKPTIQVLLAGISESPQKEAILAEAASSIVEHKVAPQTEIKSRSGLNVKTEHIFRILTGIWKSSPDLFKSLADWTTSYPPFNGSKAQLFLALGTHSISKTETAEEFLKMALEADPTDNTKLRIHSILSLISGPDQKAASLGQILSLLFGFSSGELFDHVVLRAATDCLLGLYQLKQHGEALHLVAHLESLLPTVRRDRLPDFLSIYYIEMLIYETTSRFDLLRVTADKTLVLINEINQSLVQSVLEKKQIQTIRDFADLHSTSRKMFPNIAVDPFAKIRKNTTIKVRYLDGTFRKGKYKRLKVDILSGSCEIVELSSD